MSWEQYAPTSDSQLERLARLKAACGGEEVEAVVRRNQGASTPIQKLGDSAKPAGIAALYKESYAGDGAPGGGVDDLGEKARERGVQLREYVRTCQGFVADVERAVHLLDTIAQQQEQVRAALTSRCSVQQCTAAVYILQEQCAMCSVQHAAVGASWFSLALQAGIDRFCGCSNCAEPRILPTYRHCYSERKRTYVVKLVRCRYLYVRYEGLCVPCTAVSYEYLCKLPLRDVDVPGVLQVEKRQHRHQAFLFV